MHEVESDMTLLLDSLRGAVPTEQDYRDQAMRRNAQILANMRTAYPSDAMIPPLQQHIPLETQAQAHNGFTPAEELIFHAHTQMRARGGHEQARGVPAGGARARVPGSYQQQQQVYSLDGQRGIVPPTEEDAFHSNAQAHSSYQHSYHGQQPQQHFDSSHTRHNPNIHPAHVNARLSGYDHHQQQQRQQQHNASSAYSNVPSQTPSYNNHTHTSAHMRSTTLPPPLRSTASHQNNSNNSQRHYQQHQNSISLPTNSSSRATNPYSTVNGLNTNNNISNSFFGHHDIQHDDNVNHPVNTINKYNANNGINNYENNDVQYAHHQFQHADNYDIDVSSPPIISPTLTYNSSRTTPSTLSPATPFFGSFVPAGVEAFESGYKKMRAGSH
jgi:hypothetical protein